MGSGPLRAGAGSASASPVTGTAPGQPVVTTPTPTNEPIDVFGSAGDANSPRHSLAAAYQQCREIHRRHGRSYYLATQLLPAHKRPHVHALYGFARWADDIVDSASNGRQAGDRGSELHAWTSAFAAGMAGEPVSDSLMPAVLATARTYQLDLDDFRVFLRSMAMDLTINRYATYDDLLEYMAGSAAAIGTMMVPILGVVPGGDHEQARESARQLGFAFQLTNFIRDVREDFDRGRVYLPERDLARFGVTRDLLAADIANGSSSDELRFLIEYECRRAHRHYAAALPGVELLEPRSRVCVRAAFLLYRGILDDVRRRRYDVLPARATVSRARRITMLTAAASTRAFTAWAGRAPR